MADQDGGDSHRGASEEEGPGGGGAALLPLLIIVRGWYRPPTPVESEEVEDVLLANDSSGPIRGVYIRAPAILIAEECVEVIASLEAKPHVSTDAEVLKVAASSDGKTDMITNGKVRVIVAVQQGNILATAFHPELTPDLRWHQYVRLPRSSFVTCVLTPNDFHPRKFLAMVDLLQDKQSRVRCHSTSVRIQRRPRRGMGRGSVPPRYLNTHPDRGVSKVRRWRRGAHTSQQVVQPLVLDPELALLQGLVA